jgi:exopolysaccharide production protein ExoF
LEAQIASTNSQIELTEKRLEGIRSLVKRGMTTESRLVDIEISLEELKRTKYALQADFTRAQNEVLQSSETVASLKSQRHVELLSELQQTQRELRDLQSRIQASQNLVTLFNGSSEGATRQTDQRSMRRYTVLRSNNGLTEEVGATELTQIQAGDLVRVVSIAGVSVAASERPSRRSRQRDRDRDRDRN